MKNILQSEVVNQKKYNKIRKAIGNVSELLRIVKSSKVGIPAFCDILVLYASTETYFTTNDSYTRTKGQTVYVRECDVKHN